MSAVRVARVRSPVEFRFAALQGTVILLGFLSSGAAQAGTVGAAADQAAVTSLQRESMEFAGIRRTYRLFVPPALGSAAAPLLVLLHGSYSSGASIAARWTALAQHEGLILVAPDARDRRAWQLRADGPAFVHRLLDAVASRHAFDRCRIYLFGHSAGAVYALTLSMLESELFAATAVHAGAWRRPREFIAVPYAARAIPIAIFIGDQDEFFPLYTAKKTRDALSAAGHPVMLAIIAGHGHDYGKLAQQVNRDAWAFMSTASHRAGDGVCPR